MRIIKIGKASSNDIVINGDTTVSRVHMQMFIDDEANVFVTDLNSMNGTFVNGIKITESVKLNNYDILRIGNSLVNWKEYLLDDVDAQDAYKTIVDENKQDLLDSLDDINDLYNGDEQNTNHPNRRKKKKKYIWYAIAASIVFGGAYMYLNTDSQLILNEWTSKNNSELSYTFNDDGTFLKDSAGIIKEGTYKLYDGRNKKLELSFNKTSLPVFVKSLNTYNAPESGIGALEREISNYYGNTFSIKNNSEFKMKIISTNTTAFKKQNEHNVNTRVYSLNSDYRSTINSYSEIDIQNWNLESRINNDISNGKFTSDILLEDCILESNSTCALMIISNIPASYSKGSGTAGVSTFISDINIDVREGHSTENSSGSYYLTHSPRNWHGTIVYGLMQADFDYSYEFVDGYLEINGELFKNN